MPEITIKIPSTIIVRDFAAKLGLPITTVTSELIKNGVMASLNQEIDFATASIIAEDLGKKIAPETGESEITTEATGSPIEDYLKEDPAATLEARPPVVVIMGHVDHGKTSLLDAIRSTNVTAGEAGGITQRIGAYQITVPAEDAPLSQGKKIPRETRDDRAGRTVTFIDTPGHEAFGQMRSRGAKIADVAILVVAADDGIKPQTTEAHKMIEAAKLPFGVAISKADKPEANVERVKKELAEAGILAEEYGGKVPIIAVSAKTKEGMNDLLEQVILLADVDALRLKVNPHRPAVGTIIESHIDPQQGPIASVLIHTGTLRVGDEVVVGQVFGKIRSMKNDRNEIVKLAPPSAPVQILGLKAAPQVGDILRVAPDEFKELKKKVKSHQMTQHLQTVVGRTVTSTTKGTDEEEAKKKKILKLFIILKSDTLGSAEAILESLKKMPSKEVAVEIVQRGLGIISEADILRAETAKATVYGFNVLVSPKAEQLARGKNIEIVTSTVIYRLIDDVTKRLEDMLAPLTEVQEIGRLKILAIFRNENTYQVIGGKVADGLIQIGATVDILRHNASVAHGTITQLQQNKQNVKEVASGIECGLKVDGMTGAAVGDTVVASVVITKKRTLQEAV